MTTRKFNDTKVNGKYYNEKENQFVEFELYVPYIRATAKDATEKAIKAVRAALELAPNAMIGIDNMENEKAEQKRYNNGKVYEYSVDDFANEDEAKKAIEGKEGYTVRRIAWFEYEGAYWAYDEENDKHYTDYVHDESPLNMTKVDMRAFLKNSAYNLTGLDIIGIHNEGKKEVARYCVIENSELEKCIIKKEK